MKKFIPVSVILSGIIIIFGLIIIFNIKPPQMDKTFEFCQMLVQNKDRGYRDTEILAGCFEVFSGKKIEIK